MLYQQAFDLSLVLNQLSSPILISLANLADYLDDFNISAMLKHAHSEVNTFPDIMVICCCLYCFFMKLLYKLVYLMHRTCHAILTTSCRAVA